MIYQNFCQTWDVISVLLSKEVQLRYRGTVLGILWSLANPLAFTAVLYLAFRRVLQVSIENYPLFILSALFPWQCLSNSIGTAPMLFISNSSLIKKLPFNKAALAVAVVLNDMIHFVSRFRFLRCYFLSPVITVLLLIGWWAYPCS